MKKSKKNVKKESSELLKAMMNTKIEDNPFNRQIANKFACFMKTLTLGKTVERLLLEVMMEASRAVGEEGEKLAMLDTRGVLAYENACSYLISAGLLTYDFKNHYSIVEELDEITKNFIRKKHAGSAREFNKQQRRMVLEEKDKKKLVKKKVL